MSAKDEMIRRAKERAQELAEEFEIPDSWGELLEIDELGEFFGRFRGRDVDRRWDPAREVFLFVDEQRAPCWMRWYYRLDQELAEVAVGDLVAIYRGADESFTTKGGEERTAYTFAVVSEPSPDPLPEEGDAAPDDELGF
jgi:hypothetical protein